MYHFIAIKCTVLTSYDIADTMNIDTNAFPLLIIQYFKPLKHCRIRTRTLLLYQVKLVQILRKLRIIKVLLLWLKLSISGCKLTFCSLSIDIDHKQHTNEALLYNQMFSGFSITVVQYLLIYLISFTTEWESAMVLQK